MKGPISIIVFLTLFLSVTAQRPSLPIFYASGGEGKNVVYKKLTPEERDQTPGYVWNVCSSCIGDCNIRASSTLAQQGSVKYNVINIQDDDPTTAWVEGSPEYGIGEYIEVKSASYFSTLYISNGYQKSPKAFIENSRVKSLRVSINGVDRGIIRLQDEMGVQIVETDKLWPKAYQNSNKGGSMRFTIEDVYPGTKFKDVAISELFIQLCCVSGSSKISLVNGGEKAIRDILSSDSIKLIDRDDQIIYAHATEVDSVFHKAVLEITTEAGRSLTVTPGHQIFAGSIQNKLPAGQLSVGDSLIVLDERDRLVTDRISAIARFDRPTPTYYFRKMKFLQKNINWPLKMILNNIIATDEYLEKLNKANSSVK